MVILIKILQLLLSLSILIIISVLTVPENETGPHLRRRRYALTGHRIPAERLDDLTARFCDARHRSPSTTRRSV